MNADTNNGHYLRSSVFIGGEEMKREEGQPGRKPHLNER